MGRDVVNTAGFALTLEGPSGLGYTLCVGMGNDQPVMGSFHDPSPLMTTAQAEALWVACNTDPVSKAAARAAMTPAVLAWFDGLGPLTVNGTTYLIQDRILQAIRAGHRPLAPRFSPGGGLASVV